MKKMVFSTMSIAALMLAWGPVFAASSAQASTTGCVPETWTEVDQTGLYYSSTGSAVGAYNASPTASMLTMTMSRTIQRSTALQAGASMSLSWAIAKVEANFSVTVTNSTTNTSSVAHAISVPGHYYGYQQPKVEYRTYHVYDRKVIANCSTVAGTNYGYVNAIVTYPFYATCVATSACTPKP